MKLFDFLEKKIKERKVEIILRVIELIFKVTFLIMLFFVFFKSLIISFLFLIFFLTVIYVAISILEDLDYFVKLIALKQTISSCKKEEEKKEIIKEKRYLK